MKKKVNVLLIGSGGREHAFAWKIRQSPLLNHLFIASGNGGTNNCGENILLDTKSFNAIKNFVLRENINLVIVGPEGPLVNGLHDYFIKNKSIKNIPVIGPTKRGALLEGSKDFAKKFMEKHNIPTAKYASFTKDNILDGYLFLENIGSPYVLKADGLAGGKGVLIIHEIEEAKKELQLMLCENKFGNASKKVVIEEFLDGIEMSVFILTDGKNYVILPNAKDYKRIGNGDAGLNTGGMGCVSPVPFATSSFMKKIENRIIKPTIKGLKKDKIEYRGFIFFGLIKVKGNPFVIEYNVRMGDPETQVVLPRLKTDLLFLFLASANNTLNECSIEIDSRYVATVILASKGYPVSYQKGKPVFGLQDVNKSLIFHAGTKKEKDKILTNGGRVLAISSYGINIQSARKKCYESISLINFEGIYYRTDIGEDLV